MLSDLIFRLRAMFRRTAVERELDEELQFHLERQVQSYIRSGLSAEEANRRSRVAFGGLDQVKEECRQARGVSAVETTIQDLRFAARTLLRSRGLTIVAVLTLAMGIGASTAVFSILNGVVLQPLPFDQPNRLMWLTQYYPRLNARMVPGNDFLDWREQSSAWDSIGAWSAENVNLVHGDSVEQVRRVLASQGVFETLRIQPVAGRLFTAREAEEGSRVAILSEGAWTRRFGRDTSILGGRLVLNADAYTVVGIVPDTVQLIEEGEVWTPLELERAEPRRPMALVRAIGRLRTDVGADEAQAELDVIAQRSHATAFDEELPFNSEVSPLHEKIVGDVRLSVAALWAAITLLLMIACLNTANLLLARASQRSRELAVRLSLGAGRGRIVRQLLTESLMLGAFGAGLGLAIARKGMRAIMALLPAGFPRADQVQIDAAVLVFTLVLAVGCGLFFGVIPALAATKIPLTEMLKGGGSKATASAGRLRIQSLLVVSEVTLAVLLSISAGLLVRSFAKLQAVDPGFQSENALSFWIELPRSKYQRPELQGAFFEQLLDRVKAQPGVTAVAATSALPLSQFRGNMGFFSVEGEVPWSPGQDAAHLVKSATTSPGTFSVLGTSLLEGKDFAAAPPDAPSVIINHSLARLAFPGVSPVGKRIKFGIPESEEPWETVIGVVGDVKEDLAEDSGPTAYRHYRAGQFTAAMAIVVQAELDPLSMMAVVRAQVQALDPYQPVHDIALMSDRIAEDGASQRSRAVLLAVVALLALGLAAAGIYGVLSYVVACRTPEFGVRIALGARRRHIVALVLRQGLTLALTGIALGCLGALAVTGYIESFLFEVNRNDTFTFAATAALLTLVAAIACLIPSMRAARLDPATTLRSE